MVSTLIRTRWHWLSIVALGLLALVSDCFGASIEPGSKKQLSADFLLSKTGMNAPADTSEFQPVRGKAIPHTFEGRLTLSAHRGGSKIKSHVDWFGYLDDDQLSLASLPPFSFDFVQDGDALIPAVRGPQTSTHPHWEFILEPGQVWIDPRDRGWTRASLPFSLQERNANCTHNGLLTFLFQSDGSVSRAAYQVGSETCQYLKIDLWGTLQAKYAPGNIDSTDAIRKSYQAEVSARMPVKPLDQLAVDHPGTNLGNFDWFPADEVSTFGFAIDGVHYSGGCGTRYGPYPFCSVLDLPSYSLAKSIFAGVAYMALEQDFPGIGESLVVDFVPECEDPARWQDVNLQHLLDMGSGNFQSLEPDADEFASYETAFMSGETHRQKINTACSLFPHKTQPGKTFAYHTSDTYIAGTLMNALPQARDIHADLLVAKVMKPLGLSPVTWFTRRTYDQKAQPYTGYGLTLHADDIVRMGLFLAKGDGVIAGNQVLDPVELNASLQRDPGDRGLIAGSEDWRYNNGFWAYHTDLNGACSKPVWIPVMSGYGGISIVMMPNQSLFYVFSDSGRFEWLRAAIESNKINNYCG